MNKRVTALTLVLCLLSAVFAVGGFVGMPKTPFEEFDKLWLSDLEQSVSGDNQSIQRTEEIISADNRYIIKFTDETPLAEIAKALNGVDYSLLAESESRLFAVSVNSKEFIKEHSAIIDYAEPDGTRSTLAVVNDPADMSYYDAMGVNAAWDSATVKSDVIVAVLDTGISRSHEDLKNVNILAGYDAVSRQAGVYRDEVGHGTGVAGIIAATANDSFGIAGVAYGVTVLPIKVSSSGTTIYSSDLVRGIRFAADAGAKVINMSIGGYTSSLAEQEAVNYALSKGCILIAAAGNGGNSEFADQKSYPASYEGVISVASCDSLGESSVFSQYNDMVDITAIGENIIMPVLDEEARSVYRTDSGTSYACAIVSGIAALTASYMGDVRFESGEFEALIIDACGSDRDDRKGYGIINAAEIIRLAALPIITGVSDDGNYSTSVRIGFNRGSATLNGDSIEDGETVVANGNHILTVTDGDAVKTLEFSLDYTPLSYEFREFASHAYFTFERGTATLDGFPYGSGDKITISGRHDFVLEEGDERLTKTVTLRYDLPEVHGIEDGRTYNHPVNVTVIGDGSSTLDGEEFFGSITVAANGSHVLKVQSGNGAIAREYKFNIESPIVLGKSDYANGTAIVDEENGFVCLYGESLVGIRVYDITDLTKYRHFLPVGTVYGHTMNGNELLLLGEFGVTVIDCTKLLLGQEAVKSVYDFDAIRSYVFAQGSVYGFGNNGIYYIDTALGEASFVKYLGYAGDAVFYDETGYFYVLGETPGEIKVISLIDDTFSAYAEYNLGFDVSAENVCAGGGYISVGNRLYDGATGELVLEFASNGAVKIDDQYVYTERGIVDIASGKEIGSFPFAVSDIVTSKENNYLFGAETDYAVIPKSETGIFAYGAADNTHKMFSGMQASTVYRNNAYYNKYHTVQSLASSENTIYMTVTDKHAVYRMNISDGTELEPIYLKYRPSKVVSSQGYLAVVFGNAKCIYVAPEATPENGKYIPLINACQDATVFNGKIYAVINQKIASIDPEAGNYSFIAIDGQDVTSDGNRLFVRNGTTLSVYDASHSKTAEDFSVIARGTLLCGNGIGISRTIYSENGEIITRLDYRIIAFKGNTVITEKGVYDLAAQKYIGNVGLSSSKMVTICGNNSVVALSNGRIAVNSCSEGDEVVTDPQISGVEPFGVYPNGVVINYAHGMGYLDGNPFESGSGAEAGNHIFLLSLPCGRNVYIPFTVTEKLTGIEFMLGERTMSVGEKILLQVKYLPEGADSIPVSFTWEGNGIEISASGEVTALKAGIYKVTATAVTESGNYTATTEIAVSEDLIAPAPESGLYINRGYEIIEGIKAGTTANQLLDMLINGSKAVVLNVDGSKVNGYISTGDIIRLSDAEGNITDELYTVVRGDTDGDGYISAYDIHRLEQILRGTSFDRAFISASDVNGNGMVADNDLRMLKRILLGRIESENAISAESIYGECTVQTVSKAQTGDIIDAVICISGAENAKGVFGSIHYSEGLEFVEHSSDWASDCYNKDGKIGFYAYNRSGEDDGHYFKFIMNLRFRVTAEAGTEISFKSDGITVSLENECESFKFTDNSLMVSEKTQGDFRIEFYNADKFEFSPTTHDYTVKIPYNNALADIFATCGEGDKVYVPSLLIPESDEEYLVISHTKDNGTTEYYNITVIRDEQPETDDNCKLDTLEIEGFKLSPSFDPNYYRYNLTVPFGTEKIAVYCVPQNDTAKVVISDTEIKGENTEIIITVAAVNGDTQKYVLNVKMLPKADEPIVRPEEPTPDENGGKASVWTGIIISLIALLATVAIILRLRSKKD